jgi:hypothetical protein
MRRGSADVEIDEPGCAGWPNQVGCDPQMDVSRILAHESCVLIKLLLGLLRCREAGRMLVAFDMSRQMPMWFVKTPGHPEK